MISIAFVSGKGGSGKTAVSLAAAQLLATNGRNVLLIDADLATRGLTHYLASSLPHSQRGLADGTDDTPIASRLTQDAEGSIRVIPVVAPARLAEPTIWDESKAAATLVATLQRAATSDDGEVVLIDCQAGTNRLLNASLEHVDYLIIVTEADPVSIAAVADLRMAISLRSNAASEPRVYGLVSKVFPEEDAYYQALTDYVRDIRFAGQLPFDRDVRRAFFRRELPVDLQSPGPFAVALAVALKTIDPRLEAHIAGSESVEDLRTGVIPTDIRRLLAMRNDLERQVNKLETLRLRRQYLVALQLGLVAVTLTAVLVLYVIGKVQNITLVVGVVGTGILAGAVAVWSLFIPSMRNSRTNDLRREREVLHRIDDRIVDYLIASGSSSTDLEMLLGQSARDSAQ